MHWLFRFFHFVNGQCALSDRAVMEALWPNWLCMPKPSGRGGYRHYASDTVAVNTKEGVAYRSAGETEPLFQLGLLLLLLLLLLRRTERRPLLSVAQRLQQLRRRLREHLQVRPHHWHYDAVNKADLAVTQACPVAIAHR